MSLILLYVHVLLHLCRCPFSVGYRPLEEADRLPIVCMSGAFSIFFSPNQFHLPSSQGLGTCLFQEALLSSPCSSNHLNSLPIILCTNHITIVGTYSSTSTRTLLPNSCFTQVMADWIHDRTIAVNG